MKKIICVLSAVLILFSMCACAPKQQDSMQQAGMIIRPSEFSEETKEVLDLIDADDEIRFFDIKLDDSVKSCYMTLWVYQNGEWKQAGQTKAAAELSQARLAVRLTENSCDLYLGDGNGNSKYSTPVLEGNFENSVSKLDQIVDREIPLELNKETPVWVKIGTNTNSIEIGGNMDDFRQIDCDAGIAVTFTVSDKAIG